MPDSLKCSFFSLLHSSNLLSFPRHQSARHHRLLACVSMTLLLLLVTQFPTDAFITREYTLQEVLEACTNIVRGTITSVDTKRLRAKVRVDENIKGKTQFKEIKINIAVGQQKFPQQLIQKFRVNAPILIFYARKGPKIESVGHTAETWFQTFADAQSDLSKTWWNFTHIEIYMHRTYAGDTPGLERLVRDTLSGKSWPGVPKGAVRVLALTGNGAPPIQGQVTIQGLTATAEFLALRKTRSVGKIPVAYQPTRDRNLPNLEKAHILWLGQRELGINGKNLLPSKTEQRIRNFVRSGGVAIITGQDSDVGKPCGTGWLSEKLTGVERNSWRDFKVMSAGKSLFQKPNAIQSGQLSLDDTWVGWNKKFNILATSPDGKDIVVAALPYGNGLYLITALYNRDETQVKQNAPLIQNLIHYTVNWIRKHGDRSIGS